jgi:hypothetical protein
MRIRLGVSGVALAACTLLLVSGCTTSQTTDGTEVGRSAEAVSDESSEEGAALEQEVVGSFIRGVRLCVKNDRTNIDGRPAAINVDLGSVSTSHEGTFLLPTVENCAKTDTRLIMGDIQIMYTDAKGLTFNARNLIPGGGQLEMTRGIAGQLCVYVDTEGESKSYDDGFARYQLTRLKDTENFKEFKLTVKDSQGETQCGS